MMYVRFPLSLRNVEDLRFERGIDLCHETVRIWWNRFGPMFASEIRRQRVSRMGGSRHWRWHLDEVFGTINGKRHYLWRAVDREMSRWKNNRVESSHLPFRRRERAMLRFRRMKSLQKFASVHASMHNHFNQERHLVDRQTYKLRRAAAPTEWQSLAA
jgi:putative transposase